MSDEKTTDLYLDLFCEGGSVLRKFVEEIANRKLREFQDVIQWGAKKGESLYTHVMNGIFLIERLRDIFALDDIEMQVLFSAYAIHDINKVQGFSEMPISFSRLATPENIKALLEHLELERFFPEFRDYLPEIEVLVRAHPGHYHASGETLHKNWNPYSLDKTRVERDLLNLVRAVDVIDLSKTLEEREQKSKFLTLINASLETQYRFEHHSIAENRGILSNLIHNRTAEYLRKKKGLIPILYYPNGVCYLIPADQIVDWDRSDIEKIADSVIDRIESKTKLGFNQFIKNSPGGIKVDPKCLEMGVSFRQIFGVIREIVLGVNYSKSVSSREEKIMRDLRKTAEATRGSKAYLAPVAQSLLDSPPELTEDGEILRIGELVRSYYIFLNKHLKEVVPDSWGHIYDLFDVPSGTKTQVEIFDALYLRGYFIGELLADQGYDLDHVYEIIVEDGSRLMESGEFESRYMVMVDYIVRNVNFSFDRKPFIARDHFSRYLSANYKQCSICGSEFDTIEMRKGDVPEMMKVQFFSNRLEGGSVRDPVRNICAICQTQLTFDKLCFRTAKDSKTCYIHIYPHSFFTDAFINGFRTSLEKLRGAGVSSTLIDTKGTMRTIRELSEMGRFEVRLRSTNIYGNPLPEFSESQGNIFTIPINAPGNDDEKFLFSLENALIYRKLFASRVVLTSSPIPLFSNDEFDEMFVDASPPTFRGLIPSSNLTAEESEVLLDQMVSLHAINREVGDPMKSGDSLIALIRALDGEDLDLFYAANKLIKRRTKAGQEGVVYAIRNRTARLIEEVIRRKGGLEAMSYVRELAQIAYEGQLKGESLKDNSLSKALDVAFDSLERWDKSKESVEEAKAIAKKEVARAIERVTPSEYFGAKKLEKISDFVDVIFDKLLAEVYKGNLTEMLERADRIRAGYLFFYSQLIGSSKKKEDE